MQGEFAVNVSKLREQSDEYLKEEKIVNHLLSSLKRIKKNAEPEKHAVYISLIRQAEELSEFYIGMSRAADSMADEISNVLSEFAVDLEENVTHNTLKFGLSD